MQRTTAVFFTFIISAFLMVGCNSILNAFNADDTQEEATETVEEQQDEEIAEPEEDDKTEETQGGNTAEEDQSEDLINQGDYNIYIGGEMIETEDKIIIEGESNLIPGSRVVGEVMVGKNVRWFVHHSTEDYEYIADTSEVVDDNGNFYMEIDHHGMNKETIVAVKFHFDGQQNDDVLRHYGDRGQNLEGPYIYKHQGEVGGRGPDNIYKKAEVRAVFTPSKEQAVRQFREPDWYEIPEDMGDPRVRIEVDEINDDGEFFYVHGRSNLIEGSRLAIKRNNNVEAETLVLRDGSFNFKFDYEYKETPFVIEFDPNDYQWNIVEETYGAKGQKLVGDLVVTNKYNHNQTIEYEVKDESQAIDVPDNVELEIDGSEVTLSVPDNILFDYDKYDLKKEAKETLKEISHTLQDSFNKKDLHITISGHTDNQGTKEYNKKLSKQRADEVKKFLEEQLSSSDIKFITEGHGDSKPIASNDTEEGQAKNRRVEIMINLKR